MGRPLDRDERFGLKLSGCTDLGRWPNPIDRPAASRFAHAQLIAPVAVSRLRANLAWPAAEESNSAIVYSLRA